MSNIRRDLASRSDISRWVELIGFEPLDAVNHAIFGAAEPAPEFNTDESY